MRPYPPFRFYRLISLTLAVLLVFSGAAEARRSHHHAPSGGNGGGTQSSNFDYYLLALSWSPEFCDTAAGHQPSKQKQCTARLGFVVHGLWPQRNNNTYPQDCGSVEAVPAPIAEIALNAAPPMPPGDAQLLEHEWSKHGTCSGLDMRGYFTAIKTSAEKVRIPDSLKAPETSLTMDAPTLTSAFTAANPGLTADMMNVEVDRQGDISSVQICFSKQLVFQNCKGKHRIKGGTFLPVR